MNILVGILLIAATLASFLTLALDSDFAMSIHVIKAIVSLVAIIIAFCIPEGRTLTVKSYCNQSSANL